MKKIKDIFEVKYGHSYELCNMQPGDIPFVSRTEKNNGISGSVAKTAEEPTPAGVLTVALGGSVLSTFLQPTPCYEGRDVETLVARGGMTPQEKLWYAIAIRANKYKYNYGRQANKELKHIRLPAPPSWVNEVEIPDYSHLREPRTQEQVELKDWKSFNIQELFHFEKGTGPSSEEAASSPGETPYINAQKHSNGILCFTKHTPTHKENCITWVAQGAGASGKAFAQNKPFCSTATVNVLVPKWDARIEELIFTARVITEAEWKFSFGRAVNGNRKYIKISLPSKNGEPNWDGITKFIQSCKFSSTI